MMLQIDRSNPLVSELEAVTETLIDLAQRLMLLRGAHYETLLGVGLPLPVPTPPGGYAERIRQVSIEQTRAGAAIVTIGGITLEAGQARDAYDDMIGAVRVLDRQLTDEEILAHLRRYIA